MPRKDRPAKGERVHPHPSKHPKVPGTNGILTPVLHAALVETAKTRRLFDSQVAIRNHVHPDTLKNWVKRGLLPDAEEPYASFARDYSDAQIDDEADAVEEVWNGTKPCEARERPGDWKAAAWYLERKHPKRWNPNKQPANGPGESIDVESLVRDATEQKENLIELLRDPPPQLLAAMREASAEIKALLEPAVMPEQTALKVTR
jgi:hypothetical protein